MYSSSHLVISSSFDDEHLNGKRHTAGLIISRKSILDFVLSVINSNTRVVSCNVLGIVLSLMGRPINDEVRLSVLYC